MKITRVRVWSALTIVSCVVWALMAAFGSPRSAEKPAGPSASALRPAYSPDGTKIAFARVQDDGRVVYVMNADGTNQRQLTSYAPKPVMP